MKLRLTMLCVAVLGAAVISAGCGGGNDDDATADAGLTTSSLNKAEYVKRVNGICQKSTDKMMRSLLRYGETHANGSPEEVAKTAVEKTVVLAIRRQADELRALGAPSGGTAQVEAYLAALERSAQAIEEQEPTDFFELQKALEPVNRPAGAYGLQGCEY